MDQALDSEVLRLEKTVASGGLLITGVSLLFTLYIALAMNPALGWPLSIFALALVLWFAFVRVALAQHLGTRLFSWINPFVEISLPTLLTLIDVRLLGSSYAIGQSAPLQFYGVIILVAVLRFKPYLPLIVASVGALQYALVYIFVTRPGLSLELAQAMAFRPDMIAIRCLILVLAGGCATFVTMALRGAAKKAQSEVRSHELFGKYRLGAHIASGGMGEVYRALYCPEGGFQRPVALKRIHPHFATQPSFVERFRVEASLSSRLVHRNIVQVLDFGRIDNTYFLAMELVEGWTLLQVLQACTTSGRRLPPALAAFIGYELASGLHYAHAIARDESGQLLKVIHRDLTPSNILLSRSGEVKILDFGVARALGSVSGVQTRTLSGKMAYLSPEQLLEGRIDQHADLYALAVCLWEMICLEPLFSRDSDAATFAAVVHAPIPSPSSRYPGLQGKGWDELLSRALERDPARRFQSAETLALSLEPLMEQPTRPTPDTLKCFLQDLLESTPSSASRDSTVTQTVTAITDVGKARTLERESLR